VTSNTELKLKELNASFTIVIYELKLNGIMIHAVKS